MDIIITVLLLVLSLVFKKSRLVGNLVFLFIWLLWGWNSWNGDYDMYKAFYEESIWFFKGSFNYEKGYSIINYAVRVWDLNFQTFMIIYSFIILFLIRKIAFQYSRYPALFSGLYFIIFIMEYVFMRNYLTHSLILIGLYLIIKNVKYCSFWYIFVVIIATTIHSTSILALMFLPLVWLNDKVINLKKFIPIIFVCILFSVFFFKAYIVPFIGGEYVGKLDYYKTEGGFSNIFFGHIVIAAITYYYFSVVLKNNSDQLPKNLKRVYIIIINFNLISLFYLAIYYHIPYFSRFVRLLFTIDLIFMINALIYAKSSHIKIKMYMSFLLLYIVVLIMFVKSTLYLTLTPLYKKNIIFGEEYYAPKLKDNDRK